MLNRESLHTYKVKLDDVHNVWDMVVLIAVCTSLNGPDVAVELNCNSGTRDLKWQEVSVTRMMQ